MRLSCSDGFLSLCVLVDEWMNMRTRKGYNVGELRTKTLLTIYLYRPPAAELILQCEMTESWLVYHDDALSISWFLFKPMKPCFCCCCVLIHADNFGLCL